jgi:molybdopterin molybdotransferase
MLLDDAVDLILGKTSVLGFETVQLGDGYGRVSGVNLARLPIPCYEQSTRDGYALCGNGRNAGSAGQAFSIEGEIAAGLCHDFAIEPGQAFRIMTGGLVPANCDRIVLQEECRVAGNELLVPNQALLAEHRFIKKTGSDYRAGEELAVAGSRLSENQLGLLADAGNWTITVHRRPRVAYSCSGSELVIADGAVENGRKYSSNHIVLDNLIRKCGGRPESYGIVADDPAAIEQIIDEMVKSTADIIVTTGGVGPGKYDLFRQILPHSGVNILYSSLRVRPGKATLFGVIGEKLYFGLPGPPSAVRVLFNELICPPLKKMQGLQAFLPERTEAFLEDDIGLKADGVLCLKEGCYRLEQGRVLVGSSGRHQSANCLVMLEPGRSDYKKGDLVTISLTERL